MLVFWTALAALACAATASVIWPLLRNPRVAALGDAPGRSLGATADDDKRLAVYRDRRHEIEAEAQAGRLSAEEARLALDELLAEVDGQFPAITPGASPSLRPLPLVLVVLVAIAIPALAMVVYDRVGSPGVVALDGDELRGELSPAKLDTAIADLRERTRRNATDGEGWAMLAEALRIKGDMAGSVQAFEQAAQHFTPPSARLLADYADVLVSLKGGEFGPEPVKIIERALAIDPREPKALALKGAAQYRNGDLQAALVTLRQLRDILPADSEQAASIGQAIARLEGAHGTAAGGAGAAAPGGPAAAAGTAPAPAAAAVAQAPAAPGIAAQSTGAGAASVVFAGRIDIDPALAGKLPPGSVMFVSARLPEGPRMPLAAKRLTPERFPVSFELGEADAMTAGRQLAEAGPLVIEARLSRSGNAMRASGDLFGVSAVLKAGTRDTTIRIDQVVP
jgi:cytochrome c-type biogenesis protein CcmH